MYRTNRRSKIALYWLASLRRKSSSVDFVRRKALSHTGLFIIVTNVDIFFRAALSDEAPHCRAYV
jgi:hypothetical protein